MLLSLYSIGFAVAISGLTYGAHMLHIPTHWIVVGVVVLLGAGVVIGSPPSEQPEFSDEDCDR